MQKLIMWIGKRSECVSLGRLQNEFFKEMIVLWQK